MKKIKFLADVNVEKPLVDFLSKNGFDVKWVTNIDKRMPDIYVCEIANNEQRVLITNDKDCGEIVFFTKEDIQAALLYASKVLSLEEELLVA